MECLHCQGLLQENRASYTVNRKDYHLIIDNLPAWVCEQCGEPLFEEEVVDTIQGVLNILDKKLNALNELSFAA